MILFSNEGSSREIKKKKSSPSKQKRNANRRKKFQEQHHGLNDCSTGSTIVEPMTFVNSRFKASLQRETTEMNTDDEKQQWLVTETSNYEEEIKEPNLVLPSLPLSSTSILPTVLTPPSLFNTSTPTKNNKYKPSDLAELSQLLERQNLA